MKIEKMEIKNFKSITKMGVDFGERTVISGDNATGKSTIGDAFSWCFFGRNQLGDTGTEWVKPIIDGEMQRQLDTTVTVTIDGTEYTRTQKEKWVKKRGSTDREYEGNTTVFEIDGVPKKKKDFEAVTGAIFGDSETFRLLTTVGAFLGLDWKKRREILIGDADNLAELTDSLTGAKATLRKINKNIEEYQAKIEEVATQNTEEVPEFDETQRIELAREVEALQKEKTELETAPEEVRNEKRRNEIENKIQGIKNEIDADIKTRQNEWHAEKNKINSEYQKLIKQIDEEEMEAERNVNKARFEAQELKGAAETKLTVITAKITARKSEILQLNEKKATAIEEYKKIFASKYTGETICHACGQDLPADSLQTVIDNFNSNKSCELEEITAKGNLLNDKIDEHKKERDKLQTQYDSAQQELSKITIPEVVDVEYKNEELEKRAMALKHQLEKFTHPKIFEPDAELEEKLIAAEKELYELEQSAGQESDNTDRIDEINAEIAEKRSGIAELVELEKKVFAANEMAKQAWARLEELKKELRENVKNAAKAEMEIDRIEQEIRAGVEAQEVKLNNRFELTKWKLYETQINGGVRAICKAHYNGVEFSNLNTAMQINIGIDIINTLASERELILPVFVDRAESVTKIIPTNGQIIELRVIEGEPLKIEAK